MGWPRIKKSQLSPAQPSSAMESPYMPSPSRVSGIGANYQPEYLPHPAAVRDPYARHSAQPAPLQPIRVWLIPRLSLRLEELSNSGVEIFLKNMRPYEDMRAAVIQVLQCLYTMETQPRKCVGSYVIEIFNPIYLFLSYCKASSLSRLSCETSMA